MYTLLSVDNPPVNCKSYHFYTVCILCINRTSNKTQSRPMQRPSTFVSTAREYVFLFSLFFTLSFDNIYHLRCVNYHSTQLRFRKATVPMQTTTDQKNSVNSYYVQAYSLLAIVKNHLIVFEFDADNIDKHQHTFVQFRSTTSNSVRSLLA
jgi:hypothetical protein